MGYCKPKERPVQPAVEEKAVDATQHGGLDRRAKLEMWFYVSVMVWSFGREIYRTKVFSDALMGDEAYSKALQGENLLVDGWLFKNRLIDLSDEGFRRPHSMFMSGLPMWFLTAALLKRVMRASFPKYEGKTLVMFYLMYSCYYHQGAKVVLLIFFVMVNYYLVKHTAGTKYGTLCVWGYNMSWFFFGKQEWFVEWMTQFFQAPIWGLANMALKAPLWYMALKNISYGMDYHWAKSKKMVKSVTCKHTSEDGYKERISKHLPLDYYSDLWTYLQYHFYPALYFEGAIMTFNDFVAQNKCMSPGKFEYKKLLRKGLAWVVAFFVVETFLHFIYTDAIVKSGILKQMMEADSNNSSLHGKSLLDGATILGLFGTSFLSYYGKYFVKWRMGHFWSLVDGIEPPDDFPGCVACSRTMGEFWRNWHASISKWCTRYIYIPVGGSKSSAAKQCFSVFMVFLFTAVWHTINLHFALWGALLIGFIIGEMMMVWMPAKLAALQAALAQRQSTVGPVKTQAQTSAWVQTLKNIGGTVPVLGFIFINMGAFLFGYDCIWTFMKLFFTDIRHVARILATAYANQRLVSMYHARKKAQADTKVHVH